MIRPPQAPVYMFVIDVTMTAVASGMLQTVCAAIKDALPRIPGGERTQVCACVHVEHVSLGMYLWLARAAALVSLLGTWTIY